MIELVLGEENNPNPKPRIMRLIIIYSNDVFVVRNMKPKIPMVTIVIPMVAIILGSYLSDNLPAMGVTITMSIGCATRMNPAS